MCKLEGAYVNPASVVLIARIEVQTNLARSKETKVHSRIYFNRPSLHLDVEMTPEEVLSVFYGESAEASD